MTDSSFDVSDTLIPDTNQLVADDLRTGHRDIKITKVERIVDEKRPLAISFEGDGGKPYLPNVSMRRVIAEAWGTDRRQWAGKWLRLFRNPEIKMGPTKVGGIQISHAYPLPQAELLISLITTKGKRKLYRLTRMDPPKAVEAPSAPTPTSEPRTAPAPAQPIPAPVAPPPAGAPPEPARRRIIPTSGTSAPAAPVRRPITTPESTP
jgi:hypothetical protein